MTRFGMGDAEMERIADLVLRVLEGEDPRDVGREAVDLRRSFPEIGFCFD